MPIHSQHSISLIGGGGGGQSKFTLIELLVVLLVLGILMAIAIPLIGGVREAANNVKCRSNLKQLHTAVIAYATGNKEHLPNIADSNNLHILIDNGYVDENTKLGDFPGSPDKEQGLSDSAYEGGDLIDGRKLSHSNLLSNSIVFEDKASTYHKVGKNAIRLDGTQITIPSLPQFTPAQLAIANNILRGACETGDVDTIRNLLERGAEVNSQEVGSGDTPLLIAIKHLKPNVVEELLKHPDTTS